MIANSSTLVEILKIIVLVSIFFVWVIRYENIIKEFKEYGLPSWCRDLVGIMKLSCVLMIMNSNQQVVCAGSIILAALMVVALIMHIKIKNPVAKMLPALALLIFSITICCYTTY